MSGVPPRLEPILEAVRARAAVRRRRTPAAALRADLSPDPERRRRFTTALARAAGGPVPALIAECKRRSPSAGSLGHGPLAARARAYRDGGAAALSVLTEEDAFGGSLADLAAVAPAGLPRLRKDFLLDEGMVLESVAAGADAVLLLACCLPDPLLGELRACAAECGLAVLLEVHDEAELERAVAVEPDCLGVNARDLRSFAVDLGTVERLLPRIPAGPLKVAESGIHGPTELRRVRAAGADAALVGTALMRTVDPAAELRAWRAALAAEGPA
ncbi:MAG: indole-3-glycerol-phosphate synthase [Planctomycetota bacterium]|nr:MAG: indole-3-glycerol-phosphate synthase [Planctomycetota bacterium]